MGKAGGGKGTNQHQVQGVSQACRQDAGVLDGLASDEDVCPYCVTVAFTVDCRHGTERRAGDRGMMFKDLEVGMEVLVLRGGTRRDLGNASVRVGTLLSAERWWPSLNGRHKKTVVSDPATGRPLTVHGWPDAQGTMVPVLMRPGRFTEGGASLVTLGRILGPVGEWQAKVDAARREREDTP